VAVTGGYREQRQANHALPVGRMTLVLPSATPPADTGWREIECAVVLQRRKKTATGASRGRRWEDRGNADRSGLRPTCKRYRHLAPQCQSIPSLPGASVPCVADAHHAV
jgi:hypothetical protein